MFKRPDILLTPFFIHLKKKICILLVALVTSKIILFSQFAYAEVDVDFSGFATLSYGHSTNDDLKIKPSLKNNAYSGSSILRDSYIGGQANITLSDNWDSVVQVVLQDRVSKDFDNYVEYAFLRYRPSSKTSIRIGRIISDYYFLTEYRSVGAAYYWVRPPQSFYAFASTLSNYDGADFQYQTGLLKGLFNIKASIGTTSASVRNLTEEADAEFKDLFSLSVKYETDKLAIRASHTEARVGSFSNPSLTELSLAVSAVPESIWSEAAVISKGLIPEGKTATYSSLGISYDTSTWFFYSEFSRSDSTWLTSPPTKLAYISAGYKFDNLTIYATSSYASSSSAIDTGELILPDYLPPESQAQLNQLKYATDLSLEQARVGQRSNSIGANWQFNHHWVLKAQLDRMLIDANRGLLFEYNNLDSLTMEQSTKVFTVSASVVF